MTSIFGTAIEPSRICLGGAEFGGRISRDDSFKVLDAYFERGGNFLDTAHIYAAWRPGCWGASERTLGEWIRAHGVRGSIVLATKGAHPPMDNMAHGRGSLGDIESDLRESLERLGFESVDMYWLHRDDPDRSVDEIVDALTTVQRSGRIRAYGGSNWTWDRLEAANAYAKRRGIPHVAASQPGWALADHRPDTIGVPGMLYMDEATRQRHIETGFPVAAYTSQAAGYFGEENVRWARAGFNGPAPRSEQGYDTPANRERLRRANEVADRHGCTANQIALAYLLNQPLPVYPIIGTGRPERVAEAMEAQQVALTPDECDYLRDG